MIKQARFLISAFAMTLVCLQAPAQEISFRSLLAEMTNLELLAQLPEPPYTCKQFSSYDQRSTDPNVLTDENWFANGDRGQHLRTENNAGETEYVLMDAQGPGAIVRIWSANPQDAGKIRIYLDGKKKPVVDMALSDMLGGKEALFPAPIAGERGRGWNSYLPIPYAKHCKVTTTKQSYYYHINYRSYAAETKVQSFSLKRAKKAQTLIQQTAQALAQPEAWRPEADKLSEEQALEGDLASGAEVVGQFGGPKAIRRIRLKVHAEDMEAALRGCLLEINFDDVDKPQVCCPLGDFFATAPGANPYRSLPSGVLDEQTLYANWVMPFRSVARAKLTNTTDATVSVACTVSLGDYEWNKQSLYFHAKWRTEADIPTQPRQDWYFLKAKGRGRFVGAMLHVSNPVTKWWGEGDEKIYVDGEDFPSHFGTGTEDYFGYAWCSDQLFTHAYHNQPRCDGPGNYGHSCVSRFHIMDNIPFTRQFDFAIEIWHWAKCTITQSATNYWYADGSATDNFEKPQAALLKPPEIPEIPGVDGALEGESMRILSHSAGIVEAQSGVADWSRASQVWWRDAKPGDTMKLGFEVEKAGRYEVKAVFTKAIDYGVMALSINGKSIGASMDFVNDGVIKTEEIALGSFDLKAGENVLGVEIIGANEKSTPKRYMFGLDYLRLVEAP